jgi:hypothetical protein
MEVKITKSCDRCKRREEIPIDSEKIPELEAKDAEQKSMQDKIRQFFETMGGGTPDLVVIFKGKVQITSNICDAHCVKPVQNQLENVFREAKPRQPRTKNADKDKSGKGKNAGGKGKGAAAPPAG